MALGGGGGSAAEQTTLPADVALAWASLERAKAVLQRLERGAERQEGSRARTPRARRLRPGRTPERSPEDAVQRGSQPRRSPPSGCRLKGDSLESGEGGGLSSRTVGCSPPAGSSSGSRRARLPDAQQDPHPAVAALALPSRSSPGPEGAPSASFGTGRRKEGKEASPHRAAQPPATPPPGLRAWHLAGLKEDSPEDQKLQRLKAKIREQQRRRQHLSRHVPRGGGPEPAPQAWLGPLKRKVCTLALAAADVTLESPGFGAVGPTVGLRLPGGRRGESAGQEQTPACPEWKPAPRCQPHSQSPGHRGRAARTRKRKRKASSHVAPVARRAWRERGACLCGASAWREGQKLARKILGPGPPKQRGSPEEPAVARLASAARTDPGHEWSATPRLAARRPGGEQRSRQGGPSEVGDAGRARAVAGSGQPWEVPLKVQDLGEEVGQQPGSDPGSAGVQVGLPSGVTEVPARDPLLGGCRGRSAPGCRSLSRSSQRSGPVHSGTTSGKENRPTSCVWPKGRGRHPYSPEEVREFMTRKVAERSRRVREERRTSQQACEARERRLQEVYRKQRAALSRKRSHAGAPRLAGGASPMALDRQDSIQGRLNAGPSGRASGALLRKERKGSSSSFSLQTDGSVKRSRTLGSPSPLRLRDLAASPALPQSPLPPGRAPLAGRAAVAPASPWGRSLPSGTGDRLRAVQCLARELSARVETAVARLRTPERPLAWSGRGGPPGWVSAAGGPWGESGKAPQAAALPQPSCFRSPSSAGTAQGGEETGREEEGGAGQAAEGGLCSSLVALMTGTAVWPGQPSPEEEPSAVHARGPEVQESRGEAAVLGLPAERGLAPEQPAARASRPAPLLLAGSLSAVSSADPLAALRQNSGAENSHEEQSEKVDVEEAQETGLQPGTWLDFSHQQEASVRSPPSANLTHSQAAVTDESEDRSEATSRWSEVGLFYGGSSTFCRCGLTMAAQCLREEELRARHQSALLRLREEALREQLRAEMAWLERQTRLQGPEGASSAEEERDRIRTRLKQEQAEIQHLQNVCRAARQRRRLLLRQHQELLLVRQSTARLWREIRGLAGTSQRPADAGNPTGLEGAIVPEKGASTTASSPGLDVTTRSGDRSSAGLLPGGGYDSFRAEGGVTLPSTTEAAECPPEWKSQEPLGVTAGGLSARSGRAERPLPQAGSTMGTADGGLVSPAEEEHEEDPGWTTHSKEDRRCASSDKGPAATGVSLESWASAAPLAKLCRSSPGTESLPLDSEFHKACAVLVNLSGSSSPASDWEDEATDVSLPEEFVLREPLHEACDAAGTALPDAPAVPQLTRDPPRRRVSCGESQGVSSVLHSQEKPPEDTAGSSGTSRSGATAFSDDRMLKSDSAQAGGTLSSPPDTYPDKQNAAFPEALALLPCAEKSGLDKMLFQGRPQSAVAVPSSVQCPENWRKPSPTWATGTAERDASRGQRRSDLDAQPVPYAREASSNNRDATIDPAQGVVLLPDDQMPPLTPSPSSQGLSSPGGRTSPTQCPRDSARVSSGPEVGRESKGHAQADARISCAKTVEERAKEPQPISATKSPNAKASALRGLHSSSSNAGKVFQGLSESKDGLGCVSDGLVPGVEDAVQSPVDEVLTCRSADLPSQDAAFPSEGLPAPPEDLSETQDDSSHSTLNDFPPPPEQLLFPEAGEFENSMVESASAKSNPAPALLLENPLPEAPGPLPLVGAAGAASAQGSSGFSSNRII